MKATLVSNLSRYVNQNDTFTRPAPSTYGLAEWGTDSEQLLEPEPYNETIWPEPEPEDDGGP